jgi:hypothetical protein
MKRYLTLLLSFILMSAFALPVHVMASEEDKAERICKSKIEDVYGVDKFRNVWAERLGHHKFTIHGQVKYNDHKYDFRCKIKNGNVKSYAYDGPHKHHKDDDDNNIGTAVAVGAGLAILAAAAISRADDDNNNSNSSTLPVSKSVLEDDCHDMLQYRVRDEHDYTARVDLKNARIKGHDLVGDAKVWFDRKRPHHASYTCHFDSRGRLMDSSYHLY